ncbi:Adhesin yadA precursor [Bartonella grahamii]|uniref:Adhesin yadA n=2 Tax=Bartonella grahamii TaxID=33045 RepID=A0A336NCP6_BARGR|nr:YadA-like family protein [Bartonella grahamii]SSZ39870.1 Adhesin yadA precursor [Bartonella grahamii]
MKKLYAIRVASELKRSRFSFVKVLSLATAVTFLSNASPVFSANSDFRNTFLEGVNSAGVSYPENIISVAGLNASSVSKDNYLTALNVALTPKVNASDDYANFLTKALLSPSDESSIINVLTANSNNLSKKTLNAGVQNKKPLVSPQTFMVDSAEGLQANNMNEGEKFGRLLASAKEQVTPSASNLTEFMTRGMSIAVREGVSPRIKLDPKEDYKETRAHSFTEGYKARGNDDTISIGPWSIASGAIGIAIGKLAEAEGIGDIAIGGVTNSAIRQADRDVDFEGNTAASGGYAIALGTEARAMDYSTIAIGLETKAKGQQAIALGKRAEVSQENSIAFGYKAKASVKDGIALGSDSVANRAAGEFGYTSVLQGPATNTEAQWKSTRGAVSVGDYSKGITRQITGVAAGSEPADAVNVRQLRDLEDVVRKNGWKLSVGDKNATTVLMDSVVDFSAGSTNLQITKGEKDNKLKFDLAQDVVLTSLKAGTNTFDATGLVITDGPKIITAGIDAGNKRITGVAPADLSADSKDAVNGSQLNVVATHIARYLGGGVKFTSGQWDDPKFKIKTFNPETNEIEEESFPDVAKALEGVGKSYVNLHNEIKKATDDSVFKWNAESKSIKIAAAEGKGGQGSIAIGNLSNANAENSIALGGFAAASAENSMALGGLSNASGANSVALGSNAQVQAGVTGGVAVGYKSFSRNPASTVGYDPSIGSQSTDDGVIWKSTQGAFSIGDTPNKITRQLTGVAAGYADTDAVNIAQLKALRAYASKGWKLSVDDKNTKAVSIDDTIDFSTGSNNFKITKGDKDNKLKFDLAQDVALTSVKAGTNTLDATGLVITGGPKITTSGIDAGSKKITGIQSGALTAESTEAVNGSQLLATNTEIANVRDSILVKQVAKKTLTRSLRDGGVGPITVGMETGGSEISILNKSNEGRKLSGLLGGAISGTSTDAVNGSQLHTLGTGVASYLGGGAVYADGKWTAPTFKVKTIKEDGSPEDKEYPDVASAFAGVGSSLTNVQNKLTEQVNNVINKVESESFVQQDQTTHRLTIGAAVEGSEINVANKTGADRTLSGVKEATKNNEAVNKGQLDKSLKELSNSLQSDESAVVHYDKDSDGKTNYSSVTLGKAKDKTAVGLHNVADGKIAKDSHDAITGGQINTIASDLSKILGGDVSFDGKNFKGPTYNLSNIDEKGEVTDKPHTDVGSAFKGLDDNIKNVNARIKEVSEGVAQDSLSWSDGDKAFVALHGEGDDRKASKITSLAVGDITKESTDAVNGSQLYSLGDKVAKYFSNDAEYKDGELNVPDFKLKTINDDGTEAESSYKNVSDAFSGVGKLFTKVQNAISDVISNLLVTKNEDVINIGKGVEGSEINIANKSGAARTVSGVKAAEKDNEAVNKGQLDKGLKDLSDTLLSDSSSVVLYDKTTDDQIDYTNVTFGKGKDATPVALHNVAAGLIAENSTDVINGGQIHILSTDVAKFLGGDAEFKDGAFKGPTYNLSSIDKDGEVTDKPHTDVGSAFKGLDDNIKNVNARIKEVSEGVAQDSLSWSDGDKAFVALHGEGDDRKASKITSLAAGSIASGSSDAVNGGQIYDLNQSLAKYFGGDAKYDGDGWVLPGFKLMTFQEDGSFEEEDYDSIAAAFAGINKVFKNLHNEISENIEQNALLWSDDAGAFVAQHEKEGKKDNSKITFLAEGKISEDSTDAINGGQIYTLQQSFASYFGGGAGYDKEGNWQGPKFYVQVFNEDGTKGDKEERNNVSEAFDVVNDSMSTINDRIKEVEKDASSNGLNWNEEKGSYDASHADDQGVKSPSKIINVEDGKVDKDSKEAVNGGQLWETQQMITDQVKDIETKVTEGSVQYDRDKKTGEKTNKVTLVGGDDSSPVLIDNVADGKIEKDSKEAVNGGQLHDYTEQQMKTVLENAKKYTDDQVNSLVNNGVNEANSYTDMKFETLSYAVEDVRKEARQAAAVGLAVAGLRYSDIPGKLTLAFGSGLWRSQSAFAVGAGYTSENGDIGSNLSITTSGGHWGISAGVNVILN